MDNIVTHISNVVAQVLRCRCASQLLVDRFCSSGAIFAGCMRSCCGECSEAKDQVEQLSMMKKVYCCVVLLCCCGHLIYGHNQGLFT
jgi:hypothetical protein